MHMNEQLFNKRTHGKNVQIIVLSSIILITIPKNKNPCDNFINSKNNIFFDRAGPGGPIEVDTWGWKGNPAGKKEVDRNDKATI